MVITTVDLNKTELKDRILWADGDSTISHTDVERHFIMAGASTEGLFVDEISPGIRQYNRLVSPDQQLTVKGQIRQLSRDWNIPNEYKQLDILEYLADKVQNEHKRLSADEIVAREKRVVREYALYQNLGLLDVLRALIFVINTLESHDIVWGVGRGSSVSSYILYLIGVHDVDSVKYELDVEDFLRTD